MFISYSRHDEGLAKGLAGVLAAANNPVFLDVYSIEPGDLWETKIEKAIQDSEVFVVCWCCRGEKSEFIAKEISAALAYPEKRLVAVLLCSAALPPPLAERQWIDLRKELAHLCIDHRARELTGDLPPPDYARERETKARERRARRHKIVKQAASVALTFLFIAALSYIDKVYFRKLPGTPNQMDFGLLAMAILFLAVALLQQILQTLQRRSRRRRINETAATVESYFKGLRAE